jgi:hypothetical protein
VERRLDVDASMTRSFAINPATIKLPLGDKRAGEVTVTVTNQSGAFKKGFVRCQPQGPAGPRPDVLIDGEKERPFEKGAAQQFKVKVAAKPEVKEGTYQFRLDVANSADPEADWTEGPVIEVTVPKVSVAPTPSGPKWWIFLIIGAAVLLIGGVTLFFVLRSGGGVEVPNVVGMTFEEAEKAAGSASFKVEPAGEPKKEEKKDEKPRDPKILKLKVESQDPAAGAKAAKESVIALVLAKESSEPPPKAPEIAVPSVKSMTSSRRSSTSLKRASRRWSARPSSRAARPAPSSIRSRRRARRRRRAARSPSSPRRRTSRSRTSSRSRSATRSWS